MPIHHKNMISMKFPLLNTSFIFQCNTFKWNLKILVHHIHLNIIICYTNAFNNSFPLSIGSDYVACHYA